jgi:outer membrane protein assembly factor BamB
MEQGNAQGTLWANTSGPRQPQLQWEAHNSSLFTGGPIVDATGTLYLTSQDARLHAYAPSGTKLWSAVLPSAAIGSPALNGNVLYLADVYGGLMAVSTDGRVLWHFNTNKDGGLSSPVLGPEGTAYYASMLHLQAVTPEGQLRWRVPLPTYSYVSPLPRLSADGRNLAFADTVVEAATGQTLSAATPEQFDAFVASDKGPLYLQQGAYLIPWEPHQPERVVAAPDPWVTEQIPFPSMAGILPDGRGWVYLFSENSRNLLWLEAGTASLTQSGPTFNLLGVMHAGRVVAVDEAGVVYACKEFFANPFSPATCYAHLFGGETPLWQFPIRRRGESIIGGALAQETLYLVTSGGYLLAVSDGQR